ncbi:MAG: polysaccharide deacetylase family protein, partial [Akkermansia sp.]|nr:polysaccharide deacetylase family protein [Akkermansia sp.]
MKRILPILLTLVLGACSTQQQQKIQVPDTPASTTQTTQKTDKKISAIPSAKPFVPAIPGIRVSSVSVPGNYVAITFDDGPSPALTPKVLDILKRHGAAATFFVLGDNASRNSSILARAAAEGHEIGNHTFSHINMKTTAREQVCSEISRTNSIIQAATGKRVRVMRPPYGSTNTELVNLMYNQYNLRSILWNVDTKDWQRPGVNVVVQRAVGSAKPGSIILLHDI